jgi:class 3 adenylate cyclase
MKVERTFVFVDLSGFTMYTAAHGDVAAGNILTRFRAEVRDVAATWGIRVDKWLGDGCMIVSVEQDKAIRVALDLQKSCEEVCQPLTVRVGLATGGVLMFQGEDYIGSSVNQASRLCDVADHNEVLMARADIKHLPDGVVENNHAPVELRGLGTIDVVSLTAPKKLSGTNDTGELWTRSPFVA